MTIQVFPIKGFVVVDREGYPHHKRGESGFYLGAKTAMKKAEWFQRMYPSQGPFTIQGASVTPVSGSHEPTVPE